MVIDEISVTEFWKLQNLGNGDSLYYLPYFSVCLKFFIYKITKQNKNPCSFHYNHSFQTLERVYSEESTSRAES